MKLVILSTRKVLYIIMYIMYIYYFIGYI